MARIGPRRTGARAGRRGGGHRQTWAQACYQFAAEHDGCQFAPRIGWLRVRWAFTSTTRSGALLLSIRFERGQDARGLQNWRFTDAGGVEMWWGDFFTGKASGEARQPGRQPPVFPRDDFFPNKPKED